MQCTADVTVDMPTIALTLTATALLSELYTWLSSDCLCLSTTHGTTDYPAAMSNERQNMTPTAAIIPDLCSAVHRRYYC